MQFKNGVRSLVALNTTRTLVNTSREFRINKNINKSFFSVFPAHDVEKTRFTSSKVSMLY